jgi:hypothetical protein
MDGICEETSFGCVTPAPGRARRVMRTVSFFSGTAEVFAAGTGGGVGWVLFSSLMMKNLSFAQKLAKFQNHLTDFRALRQLLSPLACGKLCALTAPARFSTLPPRPPS